MKTTTLILSWTLLFVYGVIQGQSHFWTGNGGDDNWFNTANWDAGTVPDASSTVFIQDGFNVEISDGPAAALDIELEGAVHFTISNDLTLSGDLIIPQISSVFFTSGVISGGGTIQNAGLFKLESFAMKEISNITINNNYEFLVELCNQILVKDGTVINNAEGATIDIASVGGFLNQGTSATLNNEGILRKIPDGTNPNGNFYLILDINNTGIMEVQENQTFLILGGNINLDNASPGIMRGEGFFDITANFTNTASIAPGTSGVGTLHFINNFMTSSASIIEIDIDSTTEGDYDRIEVTGSPNIEGFMLVNVNTNDLVIGDQFIILTAANGINSCALPTQVYSEYNGNIRYVFDIICESNAVILEYVFELLGNDDFDTNNEFYAYPNPVDDNTRFVFSSEMVTSGPVSLEIFNFLGQRVLQVAEISRTNTFERGDLPSGIYFAELKSDGKIIATTKIILN